MVETLKANKVTIHNNNEDKERGESKNRFRRALKNQTFSHKGDAGRFVAFISPRSLPTTQKCNAAQNAVEALSERTRLAFEETFWRSWTKNETMYKYTGVDLSLKFKEVVETLYLEMMIAVLNAEKVVITEWNAFVDSCDEDIQKMCQKDVPSKKFWDKHFALALSEGPVEQPLRRTQIASGPVVCTTQADKSEAKHSVITPGWGIKRMITTSVDAQAKQRRRMNTVSEEATVVTMLLVGMAAVFEPSNSPDMVSRQSTLASRCAAEILCLPPRTKCKFQGYLIHWDGEQRSVKSRRANFPSKNGPGTESESVVVDMLLGNDTGPVYATLWNDAATTFIDQCETMD